MKEVILEYCNSEAKLLVRAADIVANKIYYLAKNDKRNKLEQISKINVVFLP